MLDATVFVTKKWKTVEESVMFVINRPGMLQLIVLHEGDKEDVPLLWKRRQCLWINHVSQPWVHFGLDSQTANHVHLDRQDFNVNTFVFASAPPHCRPMDPNVACRVTFIEWNMTSSALCHARVWCCATEINFLTKTGLAPVCMAKATVIKQHWIFIDCIVLTAS